MSRKTLISGLILASLLTPSLSFAQTVDTSSISASTDVDSLKSAIISLLTQLIAQLEQQLTALQSQQASTTQVVQTLQSPTVPTLSLGSGVSVEATKILDIHTSQMSLYYNALKAVPGTFDPNLLKGQVDITTSGPIDPTQTKVLVNGVQQNVTIDGVRSPSTNRVIFYLSPNLYSFFSTSTPATVQLKFVTNNGEVVSTKVFTCEWNDYYSSRYNMADSCDSSSIFQE